MNGKDLLFEADDLTAIIIFWVQKRQKENKFKFLHQAYIRIKNHLLAKQVDVEELLTYIISYFSILFTSPDALEIEVCETKQQIKGGSGAMPQVPPGMDGNPAMLQMMQMLMQGQNQGKIFEETFTNIENEFYQAVAEEGLLISDK